MKRFLLFLLLAGCSDPKICRTCGAQNPEEASTLAAYAESRFKLGHTHRWISEKELARAMEAMRTGTRDTLVRPWDKQSAASVISLATRFEAYKAGMGRLFLATWLDPNEAAESNFKSAYLGMLVMHEKDLMYDKSAERLTMELYEPLLVQAQLDTVSQEKLKTWVYSTLKK
jgi:hypothetical protein